MELMLRCALPDRPGALAKLASAISAVGGDIHAVDVVEHDDGRALDDLEVILDEEHVPTLLDRLATLDGVSVIHAGPSRGQPGDAVTRLSIGIESLLDGSAEARRGVCTLIGGMLHARAAEFVPASQAPDGHDRRVLVLDAGHEMLVLRRDYRFTTTERERAMALLRLAQRAVGVGARDVNRSLS
ncbi:MAG TPA: ACT domain-containing protein [Euzebyales bacterium]|nr:ACT domain-containing protein [Euzebyales bacterium]